MSASSWLLSPHQSVSSFVFDRALEQSDAEGSDAASKRGLMGRRGLWRRAAFDPLTAEAGDSRSRLDQDPAERGQSLEKTGWESKRTLDVFLSSSCPRSSTKRGISIIDPMINRYHLPRWGSAHWENALATGNRPLVTKLQ
nr:NADH-ubiquinone oxidoreductase 49 kDa subunit [Ipomoea batatas]